MNVGNLIIIILALLTLLTAGDEQLLKISEKHSCIKQVITVFVANKNCNSLDDLAKSILALKMTECLLLTMGKSLPEECQQYSMQNCQLKGDSWNTFSTFFTHIDNLCHFYWQMLHHERAQVLIEQLSQSSQTAETLLKKNAYQTQRILNIQQTMHQSLEHSLMNQKEMTKLINSSAKHISNLTLEMESFVKRIHEDINENYGSVRNILSTMNEGLSQALAIQSYMTAQLTSIRGILYFLSSFLVILFLTSFKRFHQVRTNCLFVLGVNILIEVIFGTMAQHIIGIHKIRYLFIIFELMLLLKADRKENQFQSELSRHLNTPRLKNLIKKAIVQNEACLSHLYYVSSQPIGNVKQVIEGKAICS